jgi:hypothetical protein
MDIKKSYNECLIIEGSKSEKFKLLPKKVEDLSVAEFLFLMDYLNKVNITSK